MSENISVKKSQGVRPWMLALIIGGGLALEESIRIVCMSSRDRPLGACIIEGLGVFIAILAPFMIIAWVLWYRRNSRLPSLAFIVTLLTGLILGIIPLGEALSGLFTRPMDTNAIIGGIIEFVVLALPFLILSWLLWLRPRLGGLLLIFVGLAFGIWTALEWAYMAWVIFFLMVVFPMFLGVFTLINEGVFRKKIKPD